MTEKPETDVSEENEKQAATAEELIDGGNELEAARAAAVGFFDGMTAP